jgi:HAD superfamily hydrolase (TIGR01549 family)
MIHEGQHVDAIIFDLGGVILNIDYQLPVKAFRKLGIEDVSDDQIVDAWNSILLDLPEQRLFTLEKAAENHRIFLLSNTNDLHIESFNRYLLDEFQLPSLEPFFEQLYLSYEVGLRKPDPRIFEYVLQDAGLDPQNTLFIDDSIQHIQSANELGILTHHLVKEDLIAFLEDKL